MVRYEVNRVKSHEWNVEARAFVNAKKKQFQPLLFSDVGDEGEHVSLKVLVRLKSR